MPHSQRILNSLDDCGCGDNNKGSILPIIFALCHTHTDTLSLRCRLDSTVAARSLSRLTHGRFACKETRPNLYVWCIFWDISKHLNDSLSGQMHHSKFNQNVCVSQSPVQLLLDLHKIFGGAFKNLQIFQRKTCDYIIMLLTILCAVLLKTPLLYQLSR